MLKKLNFFPYYRTLLEKGKKSTTIRLGVNTKFKKNDIVEITVGWSEDQSDVIRTVKISLVAHKKIKEISSSDLEGESPDCSIKETVMYVLSAIYRKVLTSEDYITIIKWVEQETGQNL